MQKKRGITISMLAITIVVIAILTTTIVISAKNVSENSKLRTFGTEIAMLNDEIKHRQNTGTDISYMEDAVSINLSGISEDIINTQFEGEEILNNEITVYRIDIAALGFNNVTYGSQQREKDIFVISTTTNRIYYLEGIKANNTTYYTFTEDLEIMLGSKYKVENAKSQIIFKPSEISWAANAITTEVIIPLEFTSVNITTNLEGNNNISSIQEVNGKNVATVNIQEKKTNYTITVTYMHGDENKTETFEVKNYDGTKPSITTGNLEYKVSGDKVETYIPNIVATDSQSGIKEIKFEKDKISNESAKEYFEKRGEILKGNKISVDNTAKYYTIYVVDNAGNFNLINIYNPNVVVTEEQLISALSMGNADIKLLKNIECINKINISSGNNIIDLNGKTLSYTKNSGDFTFITIDTNANVTIKDTSIDKTGKVLGALLEESYNGNSSDRLNTIYTIDNKGTLNIESGTIAAKLIQLPGVVKANIHIMKTETLRKLCIMVKMD